MPNRSQGFTIIELAASLTLAGLLLAISVPGFISVIRNSRLDAAVRQVAGDVREARSQAVMTGWQYRIVGFDSAASATTRNRYRVLGRQSSSVAWPADTVPAFQSSTQFAGPWVDMAERYSGITLDSAQTRFVLTFDSRGNAPGAGAFSPLVVEGHESATRSLTVSSVGTIRIQ